ncbi:AAA family ATPase [Robertmurraya korlensis]|uniref:ATP-dependent Clp protease ATP-binding subunit n=1 Tax=Robertmurraya korlensis TaxID=519977 RepID=UPI00203FA2EA|nr:ATP-dependent Clp protease ATP-binding subunit [Robertmurraya korlensis]MCM3603517.1 AAA family ATPase [Robertmurraya korlensis]
MLCQTCQKTEASIAVRMTINGNENQLHLCQSCFQKEREKMLSTFGPNLSDFQSFSPFESFFQPMNMNQKGKQQSSMEAPQKSNGNGGFIDQYGRNLTTLAQAGLIDPVIGRDEEVNRVIEILNRRNKNNPVLIGEPGVGKTAIAEHLAVKIAEGSVPNKLKNSQVYLLDVASLVSNTGIRGQFEERMKQIVHELQQKKNIILFIDEIHQLVGAGSAEGSMDASNILKPALARGELQLIGATTLKEYRKIEKDSALERRFQPVQVLEPTITEAIEILKGLKSKYEDYHEVIYTDEAIEACVNLSHRYIQDRFLPDKAIDLLDEAGSKLNLSANYSNTEGIENRLKEIAKEKEKALKVEKYELAAKLREEEKELEQKLSHSELDHIPIVKVEHIHELIEKKTRIPVGKLEQSEQEKLQKLEVHLSNKVIGQHEAVKKVVKAIRRSRAGLKAKGRPIGSFLFVGPTGVGKTELSKSLADELFGSKNSMIRLDMSEYMEKHSVSKLIGSPPGYVGHEESGQLTEQVRRNPYSIILLDEIEKAHPDVLNMFLQILEDGRLTDSQGRTVNFKESVIIMTSNAGVGHKTVKVGFGKDHLENESNLLATLGSYFKPEFLNRFDAIIEFSTLKEDDLLKIVDIMINDLNTTLKEQQMTVTVTEDVRRKLAILGYSPSFGARPLRRVIQDQIEDQISDFIINDPDCKELIAVVEDDTIMIKKA